jgi:hypothetical protein
MSDNMNAMPGAGAMNDTLEFVRNFWGSMKIPGMAMPSMSPDDINKQITDLKAVESWLQMNMNMLRGTIQTLEVQSATLTALQSMSDSFVNTGKGGGKDSTKPLFESPFTKPADDQARGAMLDPAAFAAQFANTAGWWNNLQEQFSNAVNTAMTPSQKSPLKSAASKSARNKNAAGSPKKRSTTSRKSPSKK